MRRRGVGEDRKHVLHDPRHAYSDVAVDHGIFVPVQRGVDVRHVEGIHDPGSIVLGGGPTVEVQVHQLLGQVKALEVVVVPDRVADVGDLLAGREDLEGHVFSQRRIAGGHRQGELVPAGPEDRRKRDVVLSILGQFERLEDRRGPHSRTLMLGQRLERVVRRIARRSLIVSPEHAHLRQRAPVVLGAEEVVLAGGEPVDVHVATGLKRAAQVERPARIIDDQGDHRAGDGVVKGIRVVDENPGVDEVAAGIPVARRERPGELSVKQGAAAICDQRPVQGQLVVRRTQRLPHPPTRQRQRDAVIDVAVGQRVRGHLGDDRIGQRIEHVVVGDDQRDRLRVHPGVDGPERPGIHRVVEVDRQVVVAHPQVYDVQLSGSRAHRPDARRPLDSKRAAPPVIDGRCPVGGEDSAWVCSPIDAVVDPHQVHITDAGRRVVARPDIPVGAGGNGGGNRAVDHVPADLHPLDPPAHRNIRLRRDARSIVGVDLYISVLTEHRPVSSVARVEPGEGPTVGHVARDSEG